MNITEMLSRYETGNLPERDTAKFLAHLYNSEIITSFHLKFAREFEIYVNNNHIAIDENNKAHSLIADEEKPAPPITLKAEKVTAWYVDYNDLDKFLSKVFDVDYEVVAYEELGNDVAKTFNVESKPLDTYYQRKLEQKSLHYMTALLLDEACHRGLIEPGKYVVKISW